jgi:hypothetical protein
MSARVWRVIFHCGCKLWLRGWSIDRTARQHNRSEAEGFSGCCAPRGSDSLAQSRSSSASQRCRTSRAGNSVCHECNSARIEGQDCLIETVPPLLLLGDQLWLELTVAVMRDFDFDFRVVGLDSLSGRPLRKCRYCGRLATD